MRRAGLPWLTIAKITGHQSVEILIKYYDLSLEVKIVCLTSSMIILILQGQGLADVSGAIAQGPSVAKGDTHNQVILETRHPKRQKVSLKVDGAEVTKKNTLADDNKENDPSGGKKTSNGESSANDQPVFKQQLLPFSQQRPVPNMQMQNGPNLQMQSGSYLQMNPGPNLQMQTSPSLQMQTSPSLQMQTIPNLHMPSGPNLQMIPGLSSQLLPTYSNQIFSSANMLPNYPFYQITVSF